MTFIKQLKKYNLTLYQINNFILDVEKMGYGEVELVIKTHDYRAKIVDMRATKPKGKTMRKSITKKVMIKYKDEHPKQSG